jgi:peptide subunit release factor 1 (eRF1)
VELTNTAVRDLVRQPVTDAPVTSVYLNTDGAQFPRAADYEARLEALLRDAQQHAATMGDGAAESVKADARAIQRWVRERFERGDTRGLALFACKGELFEHVEVAESVRNISRVSHRPYVVPLEALLGRIHHIALVLVERDRARILRYRLGQLTEYQALESEAHRQHAQGGWAQARHQRNIENDVLHHLKDVSEVLRAVHESEQPLDALIVAGPPAEAAGLTRRLHPYLAKIVHGEPRSLAVDASLDTLAKVCAEVEQELVSARRRELLERLAAAQGQAGKAARGLRHVLEAINSKRVETLFVVEGAGEPGWRAATGALTLHEHEARSYGEPVTPVADLIDDCIEEAVASGAGVELFRDAERLAGHPVAALLRF